MQQLLESLGWVMYYECPSCPRSRNGPKKYFSHAAKPGYAIVVRELKGSFRIEQGNQTIAGPYSHYELEDRIKQFIK